MSDWLEDPLDLMPEPIKKVRRATPVDTKIRYHRYVVKDPPLCETCVAQMQAKERTFPWRAAYKRMEGGTSVLLCFTHTQEAKAADGTASEQAGDS